MEPVFENVAQLFSPWRKVKLKEVRTFFLGSESRIQGLGLFLSIYPYI